MEKLRPHGGAVYVNGRPSFPPFQRDPHSHPEHQSHFDREQRRTQSLWEHEVGIARREQASAESNHQRNKGKVYVKRRIVHVKMISHTLDEVFAKLCMTSEEPSPVEVNAPLTAVSDVIIEREDLQVTLPQIIAGFGNLFMIKM
jgi:hypothetical protein